MSFVTMIGNEEKKPFEALAFQTRALKLEFSKINWNKPEALADALDLIPDKLLPIIDKLIREIDTFAAGTHDFLGQHEDRISELETESSLSEEDADLIMSFVEPALEFFKQFVDVCPDEQKAPVAELIERGEKVTELIMDLVGDEGEEEEEEPNP